MFCFTDETKSTSGRSVPEGKWKAKSVGTSYKTRSTDSETDKDVILAPPSWTNVQSKRIDPQDTTRNRVTSSPVKIQLDSSFSEDDLDSKRSELSQTRTIYVKTKPNSQVPKLKDKDFQKECSALPVRVQLDSSFSEDDTDQQSSAKRVSSFKAYSTSHLDRVEDENYSREIKVSPVRIQLDSSFSEDDFDGRGNLFSPKRTISVKTSSAKDISKVGGGEKQRNINITPLSLNVDISPKEEDKQKQLISPPIKILPIQSKLYTQQQNVKDKLNSEYGKDTNVSKTSNRVSIVSDAHSETGDKISKSVAKDKSTSGSHVEIRPPIEHQNAVDDRSLQVNKDKKRTHDKQESLSDSKANIVKLQTIQSNIHKIVTDIKQSKEATSATGHVKQDDKLRNESTETGSQICEKHINVASSLVGQSPKKDTISPKSINASDRKLSNEKVITSQCLSNTPGSGANQEQFAKISDTNQISENPKLKGKSKSKAKSQLDGKLQKSKSSGKGHDIVHKSQVLENGPLIPIKDKTVNSQPSKAEHLQLEISGVEKMNRSGKSSHSKSDKKDNDNGESSYTSMIVPTKDGGQKRIVRRHSSRGGGTNPEDIANDMQRHLLANKKVIEKQLAGILDKRMECDNVVGALKRSMTKSTPREKVAAATSEIHEIIKSDVVAGVNGGKVYEVQVQMGAFKGDINYSRKGHEVIIEGSTVEGPKFTKEIKVEFPLKGLDMERLDVTSVGSTVELRIPVVPDPAVKVNMGEVLDLYINDEVNALKREYSQPWIGEDTELNIKENGHSVDQDPLLMSPSSVHNYMTETDLKMVQDLDLQPGDHIRDVIIHDLDSTKQKLKAKRFPPLPRFTPPPPPSFKPHQENLKLHASHEGSPPKEQESKLAAILGQGDLAQQKPRMRRRRNPSTCSNASSESPSESSVRPSVYRKPRPASIAGTVPTNIPPKLPLDSYDIKPREISRKSSSLPRKSTEMMGNGFEKGENHSTEAKIDRNSDNNLSRHRNVDKSVLRVSSADVQTSIRDTVRNTFLFSTDTEDAMENKPANSSYTSHSKDNQDTYDNVLVKEPVIEKSITAHQVQSSFNSDRPFKRKEKKGTLDQKRDNGKKKGNTGIDNSFSDTSSSESDLIQRSFDAQDYGSDSDFSQTYSDSGTEQSDGKCNVKSGSAHLALPDINITGASSGSEEPLEPIYV